MKIGRVLILLALILVLGVLVVFMMLRRSSSGASEEGGQSSGAVSSETLPVVVVAQPIRRGTRITEDLITTVDLPTDRVLATQLTDPKEAIGKLAVRDLAQGMFLTTGDVAEKLEVGSEGSLASLQIPPGYVAVSIPMSRLSGVAYALRPGDHVAVLATFPFVDVDSDFQSVLPNHVAVVLPPQDTDSGQTLTAGVQPSDAPMGRAMSDDELGLPIYVVPSEAQRARLVSQMLIKDAAVLYVGTFPLSDEDLAMPQETEEGEENGQANKTQAQQQSSASANNAQQNAAPDIITLVVSPQEAVTLKYLMDRQVVMTLALRAGGDSSDITTDAVTLTYVLDTYDVVVPAKLPYDIAPGIQRVVPPTLRNDAPVGVQPQQ